MLNNLVNIIEDLTDQLLAYELIIQHLRSGTIDQYYDDVLDKILLRITQYPRERYVEGLDVQIDSEDMENSFIIIVESLMSAFNKQKQQVMNDVIEAMDKFPADDVRMALLLKSERRLH